MFSCFLDSHCTDARALSQLQSDLGLTSLHRRPSCLPKPPYRYDKLEDNHIRLLNLLPGVPESPLACTLKVTNLNHLVSEVNTVDCQILGKYEALSYVWGDPDVTEEIYCGGKSLHVTMNLGDTLRRLRYIDKVRTLWVDAICINQKNNEEKNQQVKRMGLIYWKARRVIVWLGNETEEDARLKAGAAIKLIRDVGDQHHRTGLADRFAHVKSLLGSKIVEDKDEAHFGWEATRRLFQRPWFKRAWTVQELGLAYEAVFYCGPASFSKSELDLFMEFISTTGSSLRSFYCVDMGSCPLSDHYHSCTRGNARLDFGADPKLAETFLQVLQRSRRLECTDPRDSVYAFLGHPAAFKSQLLDDKPYMWYTSNFLSSATTLIEPDYRKENTVEELYYELALAAIYKLDIGPELFTQVSHDEETIASNFSSWIPLWNLSTEAPAFYNSPDVLFCASGALVHSTFEVILDEDTKTAYNLRLKAQPLDTITFIYVLPLASTFTIHRNPFHALDSTFPQHILNPVEELYTQYTAFRSTLHMSRVPNCAMSFALTLTTGMTHRLLPDESAAEDPETHFENFCTYRREKAAVWGPELPEDVREHLEIYEGDANRFAADMEVAGQRAFFFTEEGFLGLGPRIMKEGDEVWLPLGAKMPVVLRKVEVGERERRYKVLGCAYVHGIMEGETVDGLSEGDFEEVIIC